MATGYVEITQRFKEFYKYLEEIDGSSSKGENQDKTSEEISGWREVLITSNDRLNISLFLINWVGYYK